MDATEMPDIKVKTEQSPSYGIGSGGQACLKEDEMLLRIVWGVSGTRDRRKEPKCFPFWLLVFLTSSPYQHH